MVVAALIIDGIFSGAGLIPTGPRPTRADVFGSLQVNYKLALNLLGVAVFAVLFWLTARGGASSDRLHPFEAAPEHGQRKVHGERAAHVP